MSDSARAVVLTGAVVGLAFKKAVRNIAFEVYLEQDVLDCH